MNAQGGETPVVPSKSDKTAFKKATGFLKANMIMVVVVLVLLVVVIYWQRDAIMGLVDKVKGGSDSGSADTSASTTTERLSCGCKDGKCSCNGPSPRAEYLADPEDDVEEDAAVLNELGYEGEMPWSEVLASTELDPSVGDNHRQFVADVRRFSSGANFTSVADDNTSADFNNFLGLRRPQHVHIGADARQQPDIDSSVLQRNKDLRW